MTQTQKKYSKYIGSIFSQRLSYYNNNEEKQGTRLVIVMALKRRWETLDTGDYVFEYHVLQEPEDYLATYGLGRTIRKMRAKQFVEKINAKELTLVS